MLLGQFELQNCATARTGKVALAVAGAALLVSIISGGFAAYYTHAAFQSSQRWEQRQLAALEALQNDGAAIRDTLRQAIEKLDALNAAMATRRGNDARKPRR